jgi:hypothetical protein
VTTTTDVQARLDSARLKLDGIRELLNRGGFGSPLQERERLIQEFFFHLVGAVNVLAQLVNEQRQLKIHDEDVNAPKVSKKLSGDPLGPLLRSLYVYTNKQRFPTSGEPDAQLLFRVYNYRHQVEHRGRNYVDFNMKGRFLRLDPRDPDSGTSQIPIDEDMQAMLDLVEGRCADVLAHL